VCSSDLTARGRDFTLVERPSNAPQRRYAVRSQLGDGRRKIRQP
jgi:hypothetical protein